MRIIRYVALAIDWIFIVVLAATAVLLWILATIFRFPPAVEWIDKLKLTSWDYSAVILGSMGLLVLNVVVLIDLVRKLCCPSYLRLNTPAGRVSVSVRAIQDALRRSIMAIDGIVAARVKVSAATKSGRAVIARAYITLKGGISYRDVSSAIMNAMEYKFADIVGAGMPLDSRIYWEKIKLESSGERERVAEPPQYEPVRPQFPVEDDQENPEVG
jgi:hypothetical protein